MGGLFFKKKIYTLQAFLGGASHNFCPLSLKGHHTADLLPISPSRLRARGIVDEGTAGRRTWRQDTFSPSLVPSCSIFFHLLTLHGPDLKGKGESTESTTKPGIAFQKPRNNNQSNSPIWCFNKAKKKNKHLKQNKTNLPCLGLSTPSCSIRTALSAERHCIGWFLDVLVSQEFQNQKNGFK